MNTVATVISVSGLAWVQDASGERRLLTPGDQIQPGESLVTTASTRVVLDFGGQRPLAFVGAEPGTEEVAQTADIPVILLPAPAAGEKPATSPDGSGKVPVEEGHGFVQLVKIGEIVEADGITPLTVAAIRELLDPLAMGWPDPEEELDEERYNRGGDDGMVFVDNVAPGVSVELQGSGPDGTYNDVEIGPDGTVTAEVTLQPGTEKGDLLVVTDKDGNVLLERSVTEDDLTQGIRVEVPVSPGDRDVTVNASITDPVGNSGQDTDSKPVDWQVTVDIPSDQDATTPDGMNTDQVVFERGLASGSDPSLADTQVHSQFTLTALDGLADSNALTLAYTDASGQPATLTLSKTQVEELGTAPQAITTSYGELVLNGYSQAADGTLTLDYDYTLTHAPEVAGSDTNDTFTITATDRDGGSHSDDLSIKIVDDAPLANDDRNSITEDVVSVSGNVIAQGSAGDVADTQGADGARVGGVISDNVPSNAATEVNTELVIEGQYGTLTIQADGRYSYVLDSSYLEVQGLIVGETLDEVFTYTLTDGDGDSADAALTITISGADDGVTVDVPSDTTVTTPDADNTDQVVFESGLASGSDPSLADTQVHSQFTLTALDGLADTNAVTLVYTDANGQPVTLTLSKTQLEELGTAPQAITTSYGELVLNGYSQAADGTLTLDYDYTLTTAPGVSGTDINDTVTITATDRDGDRHSDDLNIKIVDDAPQAADDANSLAEGATLTVDAASGVLANDVAGADGWADSGAVVGVVAGNSGTTSSGGVGGRIDGQYGYLTLNADGSYEYVSTADAIAADAQDIFTYTVRDDDGDETSTTLTINVADVSLPDTPITDTVTESGLPDGSDEGNGGHTTTGKVTLPEGVSAVPVTDVPTEYGIFTIDEEGNYSYTLTDITTGDEVTDSFTYTSQDEDGNTVSNSVTITIVDDVPVAVADENSVTEDAVPNPVTGNVLSGESAGDRADTQGADGARVSGVQAGSIVAGEHVADGNLSTAISGQYGSLVLQPDGSYSYQLNNNNPMVNALKDGDILKEVFSYTLTDADGDRSSTTLTITINGNTDGAPAATVVDHNGADVGDHSIAEDATSPVSGTFSVSAPDGLKSINIGGETLTVTDLAALNDTSKSITGSEGVLTLTGYDVRTGELSYTYQQSGSNKDHSGGDNSVTDSFAITVTDNADVVSAAESLDILITDTAPEANADTNSVTEDSGTPATGNVISDSGAGQDELGADSTTVTGVSSGSLVTELMGSVGSSVVGSYGTLVLGSDGKYSYVLDDSNADVNALKDGETLTDIFSYTIKDADGDWSTTTLTITIDGNTDGAPSITPADDNGNGAIDGDNSVHESGLTGGSSAGDDSQITSGSIQISAGDGLASITIGGQGFTLAELQALSAGSPSAAIAVEGGTLVLTGFTASSSVGGVPTAGTLTYTYTLSGERTHSSAGNDDVQLSIPLSVTDAGNATANGSLTIEVIDDVPTAVADTASVGEGATLSVDAASGVLSNDVAGADGWADSGAVVGVVAGDTGTTSSGGVGGRIDGNYGYLTLNADGSYVYVSTANAITGDEVEVFTYTVRDGDGDLSSTTLSINVADVTLSPVNESDSVNESGLSGGSSEGDGSHSTSSQVTVPSGLEVVPGSGTTTHGTFTIDADGNYTYTLTETTSGDATSDSFSYVTKDANGNTVTNTVTVNIVDDVPVAVDDTNSITEDAVSVSGNVMGGSSASAGDQADTEGADRAEVTAVTSSSGSMVTQPNGDLVIEGQYGSLTIRADGFYSYALDNSNPDVNALKEGEELEEVFTYTLTDGDLDSDTADLTITINGRTDGSPVVAVTDHNGLDVGHNSIAEDATASVIGEFSINAPDGLQGISVGAQNISADELADLSANPISVVGAEGTLTLTGYDPATGKVAYSYEQSGSAKDHSAGDDSVIDRFAITVTDLGGETSLPADLDILITDTAPEANADSNSVTEDSATPATGNVISDSGAGQDELGADATTVTGVASGSLVTELTGSVGSNVVGSYGTLVLGSDGKYSYVLDDSNADVNALKDGETLTDIFSYTIKDADGDWSTTTLTITIDGNTDGAPSIVPEDRNGQDMPADMTTQGHVTVHERGLAGADSSHVAEGSVTVSAADGLKSINVGGVQIELAQLVALNPSDVSTHIEIDTPQGKLTLTEFAVDSTALVGGIPTLGELKFSYELEQRQDTPADPADPEVGRNSGESIALAVTDAGDSTGTGELQVNIIDDVPVAVDDASSIAEDTVFVTGNVMGGSSASAGDQADTEGADGAEVTAVTSGSGTMVTQPNGDLVIEGQYGTLTIRADGFYSYELDNSNPVVNALKDGDTLDDAFTYTLTDGDGDVDTAALTISINGRTDGVPSIVPEDVNGADVPSDITTQGHVTVYEHGLTGEDSSHIAGGSVAIRAEDGLSSITVAGTDVSLAELEALDASDSSTHIQIDTPEGKLTLTGLTVTGSVGGVPTEGELQFIYELENVQSTPADPSEPDEGRNSSETLALAVTDAGGGTGTGELVINIIDDLPVAQDDSNRLSEDTSSVSGNVIANGSSGDVADTEGADGATVTDISSTSGNPVDDSDPAGELVVVGEYGTLTIQPDGSYEYVLNNDNAEVNALKDGETLREVFTYILTDADGDGDAATLTITIDGNTDGASSITPADDNGNGAIDGDNSVHESGLTGGSSAGDDSQITSGSIQISAGDGLASITIGGQGFTLAELQALSAGSPSAAIAVEGGTLVLTGFTASSSVGGVPTAGTLTYTYTLSGERTHSSAGNDDVQLSIPLSVTDAGNATANGSLTIEVIDDVPTAVADTASVGEGATLSVDAASGVLSNDVAGADGWADSGAVVGVVAGDTGTTSSGGVGGRIDGNYGYLTLNADGSYVYVSTANAITGDEVEVFTYTVRDGDGDLSSTTLSINVADVTLSPVNESDSVNESGLSGGSSEGDGSHSTSSQVTVPPGLEVVPGSGTTTHGTFIIDKDGNYTYTLTETTSGDATSDSFSYVTKDANGNTVTNTVTVAIVDDAPVAEDDASSITEDAVSVTGNVMGGAGASAGDQADTEGADRAEVTAVTSSSGSMVTQPNGDLVIEGQYGSLTIRADGFYSYALDNSNPDVNALKEGEELEEVFTYTLTDGDLDSDTADLTITINGRTDGSPVVAVTDHNGLDVGHNSIAEDATASVIGEFSINAPDGLQGISVGAQNISADELADLSANPISVVGAEGTLTLTGYDPATGKVAYSYEQSGSAKDHSAGDDSVIDRFAITVTDLGGETSLPADLDILITDTAPEANADSNSVTEDSATPATGNVISDSGAGQDELGADATTVTGVASGSLVTELTGSVGSNVVGSYGTLVLGSDGKYSYVLDDSNADVNALKDGETLTDIFSYTIKDADGDWSTTTLTITIDGNTDGAPSITPADDNGNGAIDGDSSVHESGLTGGSSAGDDSQITSGSIQISAGDGLASITIGGQGFTLAELQALSAGSPSAAVSVDGGTLVLTGFTASSSVGGVPTSGTLAYTYTLSGERTHSSAGNDDVQLSIPLSVTDAGNATANGSLTIEVIDDVPTAVADTASVGEGATLSVDAASGVLSNDVAGADGWADSGAVVGVVAGDTGTTSSGGVGGRIDGNYGYLTLNADGSYVYVSTANAITGDEVEVFTYTVRDGDGDLSSTTLSINVADVTLSPVNESDSVNESGLSGGSSEGDGSHSTSSQVTVPPGLEVVPGSGTTTHGTFTIDEDGNYTYTLTETTSGDATSDSFSYVTKDANGNTVTNTVTVDIVNDVPVAVDDTNSIPSGSYAAVTGELIDGGLGGAGQDTEGADGATVTAVTNSAASTSETVPSDGSSITINGQYGVLTIEADGSYSYQRNPGTPGGVQDVFEYTLTDSDNDTDTATLTIDIGNAVPSISGLTPSTSGGELFFEERHLADGSAPDSSQLSKVGSFTVSSPDGIASLVVGGVTVISDGALTATTTVTTPQGHILEVTGFDPLTGVVSYEYTLTGRENHDQSVSDNELFDDIGISLLDQDGQSASDTLSVRIVDDEPQANNDSNRLDEDTTSVSGNVIANGASGDVADTEGADGATVTDISSTSGNPVDDSDPAGELVVVGEYGTLTIQPDGSYEYVLNNDSAGVNALKDGETLSEVFTYTLTDADGDADTATLTITIDGNTDGAPSITPADDNGNGAIDGDNTVRESGLAGGSSAGDDSQITSGSIQISAGDGLASITIGGQGFTLAELQALSAGSPSAAISVEGGTLVLTGFTASSSVGGVPTSGTLAYTYTLIGERTHSSTGNDDIQLSIPLSVTDAGKATANGSLTIEVVDDVPTAVNDSASVAAGEFQLVTDGNVLDNDTQGADGARVTGVGHEDDASETAVPGTGNLVIDGDYGKLTIHSDGSYSYQRNAGTPGGVQDVFTYTITDGDEDTANAELTIHIADDTPAADIPSAGGASTRVYESGLPDGSDNIPDRATTSGTIEFTSADGLLTVSLGGNTLSTVDQTFATSSPDGSLTARYEYDPATGEGVIHYSYTLKETTTGDDTSASFPLVVTDQDGDSSPGGNLMIAIVDDRPRAVNDQGTVTEGDSLSVNATDGVLGNDNAGADGWNGAGAVVGVEAGNTGTTSASGVATVINGAYGTLTLNADGSYTYVSTANAVTADAVDVFTYTVRDADGDETTATLTINVNDVTGTPRDTADSVDEAGLSAGTDSASDKEVAEGSLNLDSGWTVASGSVGTQGSSVGTLRINADGSYRYTLNSETTDVAGVTETDTFSYVAVDQFGNTVTNTVTITIIDDVPSVTLTGSALDQLQVDETSMGVADSADFSGAFSHHFGADGDNGDGLVFTLEVDAAATGLVDTLTGQDIALVDNAGVIEGRNEDGKVVFTVSVDASGEVTLTQSRPVQHGNASDHDDVVSLPAGSLSLTASATDGDNDTTSNSVDIGGRLSFRDDGPSIGASPAVGAVDEAWLTTGSGDGNPAISTTTEADLNVDFGADGQGALVFSDDQVALRNWLDASGNTDISVTGTGTSVLTGTRGGQEIFTVTLTVDGSGQAKYSFELKGAMLHRSPTQDHELTFSYDALDGDDDSVSGTFRVDVKDDEPRSDIAIEVDEDGSEGPFTTSADATQDNTSISTTSGGAPIVGTDGPEGRDYDVGHGTVTVHDDGRLTYTPNPDYSNYGGSDEFYVTVTEDNGAQQTIRVTATVNPVADAPELTVDAASVSTDEDVAISLGLNTPEVSDDNDQNLAATGDDPELLGLITLSGIPDGAALLDGLNADAELVVSSGGDISILLSDGPHLSDLLASPPAGTLVISSAQFEALKVLPAADAHENFTVGVSVTSYEVDGTGTRVPGVDGAESTASVAVNVDAVTDPVSLTFDDDTDTRALTINEDSTYDLTAALKVEYPDNDGNTSPDLDGSEERWFEIAGLPVGSTVTTVGGDIEVTADDPVVRVPAPGLSTSSTVLPQMDITPPADYSGGAVAVTVTLKAQDRDSDSPAATPAIVQDSVTLNLQVDPVPDAPVVEGVSTAEDTAVAFLANVQPGDTDGSEELMAITVKDIPAGWTVQDHLGNTLTPTAGELQIDPSDVASGDYQSYTIQPAGHSSLDVTLKLDIEVRDNSNDGAVGPTTQVFTDIDLDVEVTPVAETTDTDTNGVGGNDVTLTPGHDYTTSGEEDAWFSLGAELGFTLSDDWANEDSGSEKTFALLTPNLEHGDGSAADALGSSFRYSTDGGTSWVTQTYGGDPIEVPVEYLDTLQFKAAPNFSGSFSIDVQALTRDYDEDDLGAGNTVNDLTPAQLAALSYDEAISGSAVLTNVLIKPVADTATTTVTAHVRGNEDEVMPLSIRPSSSDPSETFNVTISAIPDGATLVYDGVTLTADATGLPAGFTIVSSGDTWSLSIDGFDPDLGAGMTIQAPEDSNEPFTLTVDTVSVDTLDVPGDLGSPYVSESSAYSLDILISPRGVADEAQLTIVDPADQTFEESTVDANGGVALNELIASAALTDDDGSEVLSFRVSNLPEGFSLQGGTLIGDGVWSLTEAQLQTAKLVTPANFNGTASFNFYSVTTEDDGDSLTELHAVSLRVQPAPEATINLSASIDEDVSTALSFGIQHQNGDTDEQLDAVWLSASDVDGATDFTLTYGASGVSLAQAVTDGLPGITLEDGWYKLSGDALTSIHAQGRENWSGSAEIDVRYLITDPAADGTVSDVQSATDDSYSITVNPVTDQPVLTVTGGETSSLAAPGDVVVDLNIANQGGDYDGSEQLNRIILDNVPDGVIVEGAEYLGGGQWMLAPESAFGGELTPSVTLKVQGRAGGLENYPIQVTVITEDSANGQQLTDSTTISLTTTFAEGEATPPAEILQWEQSDFEPTEDTAFTLDQGINAEIESGVTDNGFTVTLTDLPAGTTVSGMRLTVIDGQQVWTASGVGGDAELQTLLNSIAVTPPADWNKHDGDFVYNAELTTYIPSGDRAEAEITMQQTVVPVTDDADILITAPAVAEGSDLEISIDISNAADDPNWTLIDGLLYVTLNEPADMQGGVLQDELGNPLSQSAVSGVEGVPDGSYYVLDVSGGGNSANLRYTPVNQYVSGSIGLGVVARGQELDSSLVKTTTTTATATIEPVNSGYDLAVADTTGSENTFAQAQTDKSNVIQLQVTDGGLVDADGSESVGTILLNGLPNGFLVYVGSSAADATLASLGSNAGANSDGSNTWLLGEGELPGYIGIMPPAHWSGTLDGLRLLVNSQEAALSQVSATEREFSLTVEAVAEGLELNPTPSFGPEGDIIRLNLNIEMNDIGQAGADDSSVETITLQFKGMGEHAAFYLDDVLISGGPNVTYADGVYTIVGLTQEQVDSLGFVQSADALGNVEGRGRTVESENGDASEWTHDEAAAWASISTNISTQYGTTEDDQLMWTGSLVDGRSGEDTIQLRFNESVDGTDLGNYARNIESIDLTGLGTNTVVDLGVQDVLDMTDGNNKLTIGGDAGDSVSLTGGEWSAGSVNGNYIIYTGTLGNDTVVLEVQSLLID